MGNKIVLYHGSPNDKIYQHMEWAKIDMIMAKVFI